MRRKFITLLGGAAAAWPLAARAQQSERVRRIGVLMNTTPDEPDSQARVTALAQGLQEAGWAVGRNLRIDTRWSSGNRARLRKEAADLVALGPDVIVAGVGPTTLVLQQVSRTVPIVMAQAVDPVGIAASSAIRCRAEKNCASEKSVSKGGASWLSRARPSSQPD